MSVINLKMKAMLGYYEIKVVDLAAMCGLSYQSIDNMYRHKTSIENIRLGTIIAIYEGTRKSLGTGWSPWDYLEIKKWE